MTLDPLSLSRFTSVACSRKAPYSSVPIGESAAHLWPSVLEISKEIVKGMEVKGMKTRPCAIFMRTKRWSGGFSRCRLTRDLPTGNTEFHGSIRPAVRLRPLALLPRAYRRKRSASVAICVRQER